MTEPTTTLFIDKVLAHRIFSEDEILERVRKKVTDRKSVLRETYGSDDESINREIRSYLRDIMGMRE